MLRRTDVQKCAAVDAQGGDFDVTPLAHDFGKAEVVQLAAGFDFNFKPWIGSLALQELVNPKAVYTVTKRGTRPPHVLHRRARGAVAGIHVDIKHIPFVRIEKVLAASVFNVEVKVIVIGPRQRNA